MHAIWLEQGVSGLKMSGNVIEGHPEEAILGQSAGGAGAAAIDAQLGLLLEQLEDTGQLDDTIVIATSDHGRYMGGHGMDAHNFGAFEEIYNIPMIVRGGSVASGVSTDARVGLHDLCPTILELTGAEPIDAPDSRSFAKVLRDPNGAAGDFTTGYAEYEGTRFAVTQRVYWSGPWKLVFNGFDFDDLYNLDDDPHELHNLAADVSQSDRIRRMMTGLWRKIHQTDDHPLRTGHYCSLRLGAVGPDVANA